jgi:hypothetical protein
MKIYLVNKKLKDFVKIFMNKPRRTINHHTDHCGLTTKQEGITEDVLLS